MDFSQQKNPCHFSPKSNGKIILKSVTVKESSNFGCFKQSLFSSLKPSFVEKTLHFFGKDNNKTFDEGDKNFLSFGSTPAVNILDKKIIENCCYMDSDQRRKQLSVSAKELNKITPLGDKISNKGKKYALVKLASSSNNISSSSNQSVDEG